jgi:hypothetical protein
MRKVPLVSACPTTRITVIFDDVVRINFAILCSTRCLTRKYCGLGAEVVDQKGNLTQMSLRVAAAKYEMK